MGRANHIDSIQKAKFKNKIGFCLIFFDLNRSIYLHKLDLWLGDLGLT